MSSTNLTSLFRAAEKSDAVIGKLSELQETFAESAEDLFAKWEAFVMSSEWPDLAVTDAKALDKFQAHLEYALKRPTSKRPHPTPGHTPRPKNVRLLNSDLPPAAADLDLQTLVAPMPFAVNTDLELFKYRPMYQLMSRASSEVDHEVEAIISNFLPENKLERKDIVDPASTFQGVGLAIGRLCRELDPPPSRKGKLPDPPSVRPPLNPKGVMIQSSRRIGAGSRVPLDISKINERYIDEGDGFFEGQIVAVRGSNPMGSQFVAKELLQLPRLALARASTELPPQLSPTPSLPARVLVAAGPFSSEGEPFGLQALSKVLKQCMHSPVSAVILIGPFIDMRHITNTTTLPPGLSTLDDAYRKRVAPLLGDLARYCLGPVVVIPSEHDCGSAHPVYPQPPLDPSLFQAEPKSSSIISLSDPCTFTLGEIVCTISSPPAVDDIKRASTTPDSMSTNQAFKHILRQRHLYPLIPPPLEVSIDMPHLSLASLELGPNLLVIPSSKSFSGLIDNVMCIAPSIGAATLMMITVGPNQTGPLWQRATVSTI